MKCPVVKDIDHDWILEHLTKPCHQRLQILQWLLSKIDPKLSEILEANKFADDSKQFKDLLNITSSLGFCDSDQMDFITGTASPKEQIRFLSLILDTVEICHEEHTASYFHPSISNLKLLTELPDIESEYECQFRLINDITKEPNIMETLFSSKVDLLPADIKRQIDLNMCEPNEPQQKSKVTALINMYQDKVKQFLHDFETQEAKLNDFKEKFVYHGYHPEQLDELCRQLEKSLSDLNEEIENFNSCYENEMKLWCNKEPMNPTRLGPVFNRAHTLLSHFQSMLNTFDDIHSSSDKIEALKTSDSTKKDLRTTTEGLLLDFKELLNTLEVSVTNHRQDSLETDFIK